MKGLKAPWAAAVLALLLGGPGCFYLGWRRGAKATLAWLFVVSFLLASTVGQISYLEGAALEPSILFLTLLQAALAWMAYRSCKRTNAEAAKGTDRAKSGATQRVQADCFKEIKKVGLQVIVLSALTLFTSLMVFVNTNPPMGEMGHFDHAATLVMVPLSVWGVATGFGLKRAWRWAWISMLVFGGFLAIIGTLLAVPFLLMPGGGGVWWNVLAIRVVGVLLFLVSAAIGVRWFVFFMRDNVRAYFHASRKVPTAPV